MNLRNITKNDIPILATMMQHCFQEDPWKENWPIESCIERFTSIFHMDSNHCYLMEDNEIEGACFGYVLPFEDKKEYTILELFINPLSHHKGYGTKLLSYLKETLKKENVTEIVLLTREECSSFYTKNGFHKNGSDVVFRISID